MPHDACAYDITRIATARPGLHVELPQPGVAARTLPALDQVRVLAALVWTRR